MLVTGGRYRHRSKRHCAIMRTAEALGYAHLVPPDHVLGVNPSADHSGRRVGTTANACHDPFVLFGFLSGCTQQIGFAVGVLILAQRQTILVVKQAASLDQLSGGRFQLRIGVGWNEVEFVGFNEKFRQALGGAGEGDAGLVGRAA
jgi:alkanesulfonate monooxygenase SsuD/methylene tetrahydromethanopterin reductase-like flavin-dependent oxidoreductase (luciferase family)